MTYRPLGETGLNVSYISFGGSAVGGVFDSTDDGESIKVVQTAIESGINFIDTAPWYGNGRSEMVLGKALKNIPREAYYISTKVCRYKPDVSQMFDFSAERTLQSVDESLKRLSLNYVDIIQVHDMEFAPSLDVVINETLPALQKVKSSGKARFIGITGYPLGNFKTVIEQSTVKIDSILSYCHLTLNDSSLLDNLPYFKERGIGVINATPISMGLLTNRGPPSWHPATDDIRKACQGAAVYCQSKGVDISKLALYFSLQFQQVATTLCSTASLDILQKNLSSIREPLNPLEFQIMVEIIENYFKPLGNQTWEGIEVQDYRQRLQSGERIG
ncbi:L-galactose dehydrogenase-like isoform X2 [Anneissia japonica]|nr:L-galactose dehydrogenase-like isoform X2 [Anneissia japonica]